MTRPFTSYLALTFAGCIGLGLLGCSEKQPALPPSVTPPPPLSEITSDDHDHPAHGDRGGHMIDLSDGSQVEVAFADDVDLFTVFVDNPGKVSKVEMITTIDGKETVYEYEKTNTFDSAIFGLTSAELGTAAKIGEGVDIQLIITSQDGVLTGKFEHHQH